MAVNKGKRPASAAQTLRRRLNHSLKDRAYETLHNLHRGFTLTHSTLERLERLNIVPRNQIRPCRYLAEELQALTNSAFLSILRDAETHDAAYFEKLRLVLQGRPYPKLLRLKSTATTQSDTRR